MPAHDDSQSFGALLREYRLRAGFSQQTLAERAQISTKAVGAMEQGARKAPYRYTVTLLCDALELTPIERTFLENASDRARARVRAVPAEPAPVPNNLPVPLTPFIDRNDVGGIIVLLDTHRLVTVSGSGGVGKTRTAIEAASRRSRTSREAVAFVDLSSLGDGSRVAERIAAVTGTPVTASESAEQSIVTAMAARHLTLVLDNCEHILNDVALTVRSILAGCPGVTILTTSREILGTSNEVVYRLPSLRIPRLAVASMDEALTYSAIALFVQRAGYADARIAFTLNQVPLVTEICSNLDGIPLAIELVAAQLPSIGLGTLASRLHAALTVTGARDLPQRQQTMSATIRWSYDLLDETERRMLEAVTIFAGGFTLAAAEDVCAETIPLHDIVYVLTRLVDKSLVNILTTEDPPRYSLFALIRAFARERLEERGSHRAIAIRHAEWLASAGASFELKPATEQAAFVAELDNARTAVSWCLAQRTQDMVALAGRVASGLRRIWSIAGRNIEVGGLIDDILARLEDCEKNVTVIAKLWVVRMSAADNPNRALIDEATPFLERAGDGRALATANAHLALTEVKSGEFASAEASFAKTAAYYDADDSRKTDRFYTYAANVGAIVYFAGGRYAEARGQLLELDGRIGAGAAGAYERAGLHRILAEVEFADGQTAPSHRDLRTAAGIASRGDDLPRTRNGDVQPLLLLRRCRQAGRRRTLWTRCAGAFGDVANATAPIGTR